MKHFTNINLILKVSIATLQIDHFCSNFHKLYPRFFIDIGKFAILCMYLNYALETDKNEKAFDYILRLLSAALRVVFSTMEAKNS